MRRPSGLCSVVPGKERLAHGVEQLRTRGTLGAPRGAYPTLARWGGWKYNPCLFLRHFRSPMVMVIVECFKAMMASDSPLQAKRRLPIRASSWARRATGRKVSAEAAA